MGMARQPSSWIVDGVHMDLPSCDEILMRHGPVLAGASSPGGVTFNLLSVGYSPTILDYEPIFLHLCIYLCCSVIPVLALR